MRTQTTIEQTRLRQPAGLPHGPAPARGAVVGETAT